MTVGKKLEDLSYDELLGRAKEMEERITECAVEQIPHETKKEKGEKQMEDKGFKQDVLDVPFVPQQGPNAGEREHETGLDELFKSAAGELDRSFRKLVQESMMRSRSHFDVQQTIMNHSLARMVAHSDVIQQLTLAHASNNNDTANLVNKAAVDHRDNAHSLTWGVNETDYAAAGIINGMTNAGTAQKGLDVLLAEAVNNLNIIAKSLSLREASK